MDAPITSLREFEGEHERWDRLYRADPNSQVFLSWAWLRAFLNDAPRGWMILIVRDGDELVAALPLCVRSIPSALLPVARELSFASAPIADYQGMLCLPDREPEAIRALATAIGQMRWDRLSLTDVCDTRVLKMLALVRGEHGTLETVPSARCLRTGLPATWGEYAASLGSGTRATTVRSVRRMEHELPAFRISSPTGADIDLHIDAAVRLHHSRWGGNLRRSRAKYGRLHRAAYDRGCLRLIMLWDGERPIASAVAYLDDVHRTYNLYQLVYDAEYRKFSPGKGVIGLAIRDAIENGYASFDFLRGYEEYKLSYAKDLVITTHHRLTRQSLRSAMFGAIQPTYHALKAAAVRVVYGPGRMG